MTISGRSCRRKNKSGKSYICNVAATVLAGYALSRQDLYGRKIFNWFIAIPMWFGVGLIPTYLTINSLGLVNKLKKKNTLTQEQLDSAKEAEEMIVFNNSRKQWEIKKDK